MFNIDQINKGDNLKDLLGTVVKQKMRKQKMTAEIRNKKSQQRQREKAKEISKERVKKLNLKKKPGQTDEDFAKELLAEEARGVLVRQGPVHDKLKKRLKTPDEIEKMKQEEKRADARIIKELNKRESLFDYSPATKRKNPGYDLDEEYKPSAKTARERRYRAQT